MKWHPKRACGAASYNAIVLSGVTVHPSWVKRANKGELKGVSVVNNAISGQIAVSGTLARLHRT